MRKMRGPYGEINVVEHVMTRNFWEYCITDEKFNDDVICALVIGFATEMGDISLNEIKPYVMTRTKNLNNVMPADGWKWI